MSVASAVPRDSPVSPGTDGKFGSYGAEVEAGTSHVGYYDSIRVLEDSLALRFSCTRCEGHLIHIGPRFKRNED